MTRPVGPDDTVGVLGFVENHDGPTGLHDLKSKGSICLAGNSRWGAMALGIIEDMVIAEIVSLGEGFRLIRNLLVRRIHDYACSGGHGKCGSMRFDVPWCRTGLIVPEALERRLSIRGHLRRVRLR